LADAIDLYVGGGVGAAMVELDDGDGNSEDDTVLAYQFLVGLAFYTSDNFAITGGYRLWTTSDLEIDEVDVDVPLYHTAEIGVRFEF
jgi:opacity protein-like surface antigen